MESIEILIPLLFRGIERIIIDLSGVLSICLGYKLFNTAMEATGDLEAGTEKIKLKMKRIAPGTFFALFGAVILTTALYNSLSLGLPLYTDQLEQNKQSGVPPQKADALAVNYVDNAPLAIPNEQDIHAIQNIGKVFSLIRHYQPGAGISPLDKQTINSSITELLQYREILIDKIFGINSYQSYQSVATAGGKSTHAYQSMSASEKEKYDKILQLMEFAQWLPQQ